MGSAWVFRVGIPHGYSAWGFLRVAWLIVWGIVWVTLASSKGVVRGHGRTLGPAGKKKENGQLHVTLPGGAAQARPLPDSVQGPVSTVPPRSGA